MKSSSVADDDLLHAGALPNVTPEPPYSSTYFHSAIPEAIGLWTATRCGALFSTADQHGTLLQ